MKKIPWSAIIVAGWILAVFLRLFLVGNTGFEADISFWKSWGLAVSDFGIVRGLPLTNFNYPTPFGYFLAVMVRTYSIFADPHNFNEFWRNNNLWFLFVAKLPAILADFGIAGIILWIGKNTKQMNFPQLPFTFYQLLALVYLLNPVSIIDGAWWGQLDSLGILLFLLAFLFVLRRNSFVAGVIFMVAMMTKLQNMIYGPIFFLLVWQISGWTGLLQSVAGSALTFFGLNIEFILSHNSGRVIESLTGNYDYFPWLSLNAFNPWWIYSGAAGMKGSDKTLVLGLLSAKHLGLTLFSGGYLFAVLHMLWKKHGAGAAEYTQKFLEAFIIVNGSFFLFQTESHDRYAFPLIVVLLLWGAFAIRERLTQKETLQIFTTRPFRIFSIIYILFSLFYFYNLHTALIFNYPNNGIPVLSALTAPWLTIAVSYVFTSAFLWFILWLARDSFWTLILPISLISLMLIFKNMPLITHRPVSIESLTPTEYKQDYGSRQINMPINAGSGFKNWSALSVQYAFYRHGIGTHASGYQIFDVGRLFRRFSFDYGIDTEAGTKASVTFEVWGDDKRLFASEKMGRFDLPRHADVDISGVRMLKLVVTDAGDGITDDHADWLNPKLYE